MAFTERMSGYAKVRAFSKSTPAVAVPTTPAVALSSPESEPMATEPLNTFTPVKTLVVYVFGIVDDA